MLILQVLIFLKGTWILDEKECSSSEMLKIHFPKKVSTINTGFFFWGGMKWKNDYFRRQGTFKFGFPMKEKQNCSFLASRLIAKESNWTRKGERPKSLAPLSVPKSQSFGLFSEFESSCSLGTDLFPVGSLWAHRELPGHCLNEHFWSWSSTF